MTLSVVDSLGGTVWSHEMEGRKGFNQLLWDLVTEQVDGQDAYFWRYLRFARAGTYGIQVSGEGVGLKGQLTVVER